MFYCHLKHVIILDINNSYQSIYEYIKIRDFHNFIIKNIFMENLWDSDKNCGLINV